MNPLENYKKILEHHFGAGAATFSVIVGTTNPVIGALNRSTDYTSFRAAFPQRLARLAAKYPNGNSNLPALLKTLNDLASEKNWEGAYSEIVALDFLNSDPAYNPDPIQLDKTVPATDTLSVSLGYKNSNYDGYYEEFGIFFDVKVLSDKSRAIFDSVIAAAVKARGVPPVRIAAEYQIDSDFEEFQDNFTALVKELTAALDPTTQPKFIPSTVISGLSYRLIWQSGTLATMSSYNPYRHAEEHHTLLFKHAKKFSRTAPSLIVFVVFPWFSEKGSMDDDGSVFYRAFARRFFCQYAKDARPAETVVKSFKGTETIAQVTEKLSGVLFLEDISITATDPSAQNVKGFAYFNPNALHRADRRFSTHLNVLGIWSDDFAHDNY